MKEEIEQLYKKLENVHVACGKVAELSKGFVEGCGKPISILKVYACVDCSAPFHRKCLLKHMKEDMEVESLSKMPLKEAFKKLDKLKPLTNII